MLFHHRALKFYWLVFAIACVGLVASTIRAAILGALVGMAYLVAVRLRIMGGVGVRAAIAGVLLLACVALPFAIAARDGASAPDAGGSAYMAMRRWPCC